MRRKIGIMLGVTLLVAGLAAPAGADKGGHHPRPPSDTGLEVTVEPSTGYMWANSVGDKILFDVTVTNNSGGNLTGVTVTFSTNDGFNGEGTFDDGVTSKTFPLADGVSWMAVLTYLVGESDFDGLPLPPKRGLGGSVTVGTVTATASGLEPPGTDGATMTARPVAPCDQKVDGGGFTYGPYPYSSGCAFTAKPNTHWTLTSTRRRDKSGSPSARVRDGLPGNSCNFDGGGAIPSADLNDFAYFPSEDDDGNIVCLGVDVAGEPIPVRNANTFYLIVWKGNTVTATPVGP